MASSHNAGPPGTSGRGARASGWSWLSRLLSHPWWTGIATLVALVALVVPIIIGSGSSPSRANKTRYSNKYSSCTAQGSGNTVNCSVTETPAGLSNNPRARIVQLTGSYSVQRFHDAIRERDTRIVALYLKSGEKATTIYEGASIILFGFQGTPTQNGDPVALIKTFQAAGFKVDDELKDSYLMGALTNNDFPLMFNTDLAPKGYTGGYWSGTFVGSLLFWIVQRAAWAGPTNQDIQVIKYLISQGADCKVPLSFLKFNKDALSGTSPYQELLPMMQSCAK